MSEQRIDGDSQIQEASIKDASIATDALINATKLGDGQVNNTEFGYLDGVVSNVQTQLNNRANVVHTHDASDIVTGVFAMARLGTGTADSIHYLRGDGTWALVAASALVIETPTGTIDGTNVDFTLSLAATQIVYASLNGLVGEQVNLTSTTNVRFIDPPIVGDTLLIAYVAA